MFLAFIIHYLRLFCVFNNSWNVHLTIFSFNSVIIIPFLSWIRFSYPSSLFLTPFRVLSTVLLYNLPKCLPAFPFFLPQILVLDFNSLFFISFIFLLHSVLDMFLRSLLFLLSFFVYSFIHSTKQFVFCSFHPCKYRILHLLFRLKCP